ncbi:MAG: hypothetical protein JWP97_4673 [Labilithrix sp.]|nr:hypothetical protein [Labilithrix sp.]
MKDLVVVIGLVLASAVLVTAHVAIVYGLAFRLPRWRALVAFFVAPLAPFWAFQEKMRIRAFLWVGALVIYVIATILSRV